MNLEALCQQYLQVLREKGYAERSIYTCGKDLEQIQAFFGPDRDPKNILKGHVGQFYKSPELLMLPKGKERNPKTIQKTRHVLKMLMRWAVEQGHIDLLPIPKN